MPKNQLEARVIPSYNAGSVRAFSGREYIRSEWRLVPVGFEEEADKNELLEVRPYKDETTSAPVAAAPVKKTITPAAEVTPESLSVDEAESPDEEKKSHRRRKSHAEE